MGVESPYSSGTVDGYSNPHRSNEEYTNLYYYLTVILVILGSIVGFLPFALIVYFRAPYTGIPILAGYFLFLVAIVIMYVDLRHLNRRGLLRRTEYSIPVIALMSLTPNILLFGLWNYQFINVIDILFGYRPSVALGIGEGNFHHPIWILYDGAEHLLVNCLFLFIVFPYYIYIRNKEVKKFERGINPQENTTSTTYDREFADSTGSIPSAIFWMGFLSLLLIWLPVLGPLIAGYVGGRKAGSALRGFFAAILPSLMLGILLFLGITYIATLPLLGAIVATIGVGLLIIHNIGLVAGAIIGGTLTG